MQYGCKKQLHVRPSFRARTAPYPHAAVDVAAAAAAATAAAIASQGACARVHGLSQGQRFVCVSLCVFSLSLYATEVAVCGPGNLALVDRFLVGNGKNIFTARPRCIEMCCITD